MAEANQYKFLKVPWADELTTDQTLSYEVRKYPYYYWNWADTLMQEIEIHIFAGYEPVDLLKNVKFSSSIADYSLNFKFSKGVSIGRRILINKKRIVSSEEYLKFKKFYNNVIKGDSRQILLIKNKS